MDELMIEIVPGVRVLHDVPTHREFVRLKGEIERLKKLLEVSSDRVIKLAFEMPAPNAYTPQFVALGQAIQIETSRHA